MLRHVALVRTDVSEERTTLRLLVTANVPSSMIIFTPMMEATRCTETLVLSRATRRHVPEDGILQDHVMFSPYMATYILVFGRNTIFLPQQFSNFQIIILRPVFVNILHAQS
jgi:hypothetical protein